MSVVSPARALLKKLEMSGEVEGRLSLSPHRFGEGEPLFGERDSLEKRLLD